MERMMRVQDVLLKAMAKKITWWAAAEIIGVSDRTMRRWRERLQEHGYSGLADRRKGKPSGKRIPLPQVEEVLRLYKEMYYDLSMEAGENQKQVSTGSHTPLGISQKAQDSHFPTAPITASGLGTKTKAKPKAAA
jgi:transposase